jgi:hypothetical protein
MSLKAELETWAAALKAYDEEDFDQSLELFSVRPFPFPSHISYLIPPPHFPGYRRLVENPHKYGSYLCHPR